MFPLRLYLCQILVPKRLLISPITIVINLWFLDTVLAYLQLLYGIAAYPIQACWQNLGTCSCRSEQCGMPLGVYHEFCLPEQRSALQYLK